METIQGTCSCGEQISIEINADESLCVRTDRKRPFYPGEYVDSLMINGVIYPASAVTTLRCRRCGGYVEDTVPEAAFDNDSPQKDKDSDAFTVLKLNDANSDGTPKILTLASWVNPKKTEPLTDGDDTEASQ